MRFREIEDAVVPETFPATSCKQDNQTMGAGFSNRAPNLEIENSWSPWRTFHILMTYLGMLWLISIFFYSLYNHKRLIQHSSLKLNNTNNPNPRDFHLWRSNFDTHNLRVMSPSDSLNKFKEHKNRNFEPIENSDSGTQCLELNTSLKNKRQQALGLNTNRIATSFRTHSNYTIHDILAYDHTGQILRHYYELLNDRIIFLPFLQKANETNGLFTHCTQLQRIRATPLPQTRA